MIVKRVEPDCYKPVQITLTDLDEVRLLYSMVSCVERNPTWLCESQVFAGKLRKLLEKVIDG